MNQGKREEDSAKELIAKIDFLSKRAENFRLDAIVLEEMKESILLALSDLKHTAEAEKIDACQKEELLNEIERINFRISAVNVSVGASRTTTQEYALSDVNELINKLIIQSKTDVGAAIDQCTCYLNTCKSDPDCGATDRVFEGILLGCSLDDQKSIRKRLYGLLNYLRRTENV